MRIGTSLTSGIAAPSHPEGARWMIERARAAADAELDLLSLGDRHATAPRVYYQNVPMLARMLAEWNDAPVGCLFLLPLWHPVLVAEQIGTLASIHGGQFIVQTGVGGGADQFGAMGKRLATRGRDIEESIRLIDALLAGETVSSDRFGIRDASISPLPTRPVEWWLGGRAKAAIERAARVSGILYAGPSGPGPAAEDARAFLDALSRIGREPAKLVIRQDVVVAPTDAEAEVLAAAVLDSGYRGMGRGDVAVGSPETVAEVFARYRDIGYTDIAARQMSIPQSAALESIGMLGSVRNILAG